MANVFVSYSRDSAETVKSLIEDIEALGHDVWFDQELSGGQVWWDKILESIRETDVFVVAVDQSSLKSKACISEFEYAHALGVPVLPVVTDANVSTNLLPRILQLVQHVPYVEPDRTAALKLARAFSSMPEKGDQPDPLPTAPPAPMSYISEIAEKIGTENLLNFEQQSALLIELKGGLIDAETEEDAIILLKKLRKRRDLLATIATEIDDLLRPAETQEEPHTKNETNVRETSFDDMIEAISQPEPGISQNVQSEELAEGLAESATAFLDLESPANAKLWEWRWKGAIIGGLLALAYCLVLYQAPNWHGANESLFVFGLFVLPPAMLTGFLTGNNLRRLLVVVSLAIIVPIVWYLANPDHSDWRYASAGVLGPGFGALAGAVLSALWERLGRSS